MNTNNSLSERPVLQPSTLGKYVGLDTCPQYFKFKVQNEGLDELGHDETDFQEAFHGGNVIEKKAGDDFEENVVEVIVEHVSDLYNLEELTLQTVSESLPQKTKQKLEEIGEHISLESIKNGDYTVHSVPADKIRVSDSKGFVQHVKNKHDIVLDRGDVNNVFFSLGVEYTNALIGAIVTDIDTPGGIRSDNVKLPESRGEKQAVNPTDNRAENNPVVLFQPTFATQIGAWRLGGDADLVFIWPSENQSEVEIKVVDVKLAIDEQTNHQIQTVTYSTAISKLSSLTKNSTPVNISAGILTQQAEFMPLTPDATPSFDIDSREADLKRLTKEGGVLDSVFETAYEDTSYQLDQKCGSCEFNEACYTMAIENNGLELLGIDRGVQRVLINHGVTDLKELAELARPVEEGATPNTHAKPAPERNWTDVYNSLATIPGVGEQLPKLIQKAQALLQNLDPEQSNTRQTRNAPYITNTGYGSLPSDNWINTREDGENLYCEGSMVRVYVNVQFDHIRDCIDVIAFNVTASASSANDVSHCVIDDELSNDRVDAHHNELALLEEFATNVFDAIEHVSDGIDLTEYKQEHPFVHFFTYAEKEADVLEEKLALYSKEHISLTESMQSEYYSNTSQPSCEPEVIELNPSNEVLKLRELLGFRAGAEQEMITPVLPDVKKRVAVRQPTLGLINVFDEFYPGPDEVFKRTDWTYTPKDASRLPANTSNIDLTDMFWYRFFANDVQYENTADGIALLHGDSDGSSPDGWYRSRVRTAAQIPIAYIWGATGKITDQWDLDEISSDGPIAVTPYLYHWVDDEKIEIETGDVEALVTLLCKCLRHVEQGIQYKSSIFVDGTSDEEPTETDSNANTTQETF